MKWNNFFSLRISELVVKQLKEEDSINFQNAEALQEHIAGLVTKDFEREEALDKEVLSLMDQLEKEGHNFERYKMFPLLKKQLAKQKGIVL